MNSTALTTGQKTAALRVCTVFAGTPAEALGLLAEMMTSESLRAGETLFEAGEPSDRVFLIVSGRLGVFLGDEKPVRTLEPGQLLGEYSMFQQHVRTATVRSLGDSLLLSLDHQRFEAFLLQFPRAALVLLSTAVARLTELESDRMDSV